MSAETPSISLSYWGAVFLLDRLCRSLLHVRVSFGMARSCRAAKFTIVGLIGIVVVLVQYSMRGV